MPKELADFMRVCRYIFMLIGLVWLGGCAPVQQMPATNLAVKPHGIYHTAREGETIWRIANAYRVTIQDIVDHNQIIDISRIEKNQRIFIPGVGQIQQIKIEKDDPDKRAFAWPVKGEILGAFGSRRGEYLNKGIKIQAREGDPVHATRQGRVVFADHLMGYAYTVIVDHLDGYFSVYSQNAKLLVKLGDFIFKGDRIAQVGSQGRQPFLYFEIRKDGRADNPLYYLPRL
ncbi:MAG: peptidoglycan DD-metalloendopeptidase family protein [Candidatus Omnitrophica bacterium]|nr:peptidoglycan DD-metalloendopeptidase family protein [Candidatus Omnitrophota bacterium]